MAGVPVRNMGFTVTGIVAFAAGYLLGRLRPWQRMGDWAADQVHHAGAWVQGGTAPRTSWRILRAPATEAQAPMPVRDPNRATKHVRGPHEETRVRHPPAFPHTRRSGVPIGPRLQFFTAPPPPP
jgi:hypothetical protein